MINEENDPSLEHFYPAEGSQDEIIRMDDEVAKDLNNVDIPEEEEMNEFQFDNLIPIDKLKNGWFAISGLVCSAAAKIQTKAVETYNSETMKEYREKTAAVVTPAWEKTCEVASSGWEATKTTATVVAEKTKEGVHVAAESVKPALDKVSESAMDGWKYASEAATSAAEYASEQINATMSSTTGTTPDSHGNVSSSSGSFQFTQLQANFFEDYEQKMLRHGGTDGTNHLLENVLYGEDKLKEIEIHCPGPESPIVTIRDIAQELYGTEMDENGNEVTKTKCMILKLTGLNFNMKMEINCDEEE